MIRRLVQAQRSTFFCPTCQQQKSTRQTRTKTKSLRSQ
ncbi:MAG: zinc finger domain-containing protein [Planctomycetota bacterium]